MTPRKCPTCQAGLRPVELRGNFTATLHPAAIFWNGERLKLTPMAARLLTKLATAEYVDKRELRGPIATDRTMNVHLSAIRRELPAGVVLENDFGKGYRLILPA